MSAAGFGGRGICSTIDYNLDAIDSDKERRMHIARNGSNEERTALAAEICKALGGTQIAYDEQPASPAREAPAAASSALTNS